MEEHLTRKPVNDEASHIKPALFPKFAGAFFGFVVNDTLAPELAPADNRQDFTRLVAKYRTRPGQPG